jgi:RNA polymerase sigma-70 factor, ECF subfamily
VIFAIGRRMTGSFADAEDIAQQTFMKAFVRLSSFEKRCSFSTWLTSIAINEVRMWRRKRSRLHETADLNCEAEGRMPQRLEIADPGPNPESIYSEKERGALLLSRLRELSPSSSIALKVCDLEEKSTAAAAVLLGITATALKSRRSRGRAALRTALAPYLS